jgi:hypothetical protein
MENQKIVDKEHTGVIVDNHNCGEKTADWRTLRYEHQT